MQARYQIQLSPVRGIGLLLALLVALVLAASAGFMAHSIGTPLAHPGGLSVQQATPLDVSPAGRSGTHVIAD
jgi:hypothetical protein